MRLQQEAVSERELRRAQAFLAGNFALTIETPDAIALKVLNALFYGLELKDLPAYPEQVYKVTTDDIQRVSRAYLRPGPPCDRARRRRGEVPARAQEGWLRHLEIVKLDELDLTAVNLKHVRRAAKAAPASAPAPAPPAR